MVLCQYGTMSAWCCVNIALCQHGAVSVWCCVNIALCQHDTMSTWCHFADYLNLNIQINDILDSDNGLIQFSQESFVFLFAIYRHNAETVLNYNYACYFIWVKNLVSAPGVSYNVV
jgi:hypothetical protein